jgi:uncharacterized protein (TIGR02448 family)
MAFSHRLLIVPMLLTACWSPLASAFDLTLQSTVSSAYATSKVTSAPFDKKVVLAAQDDAAAFIATDGQWRGARLESALIICVAPNQNLTPATLNWRKQFSSNNHLCISESFHA